MGGGTVARHSVTTSQAGAVKERSLLQYLGLAVSAAMLVLVAAVAVLVIVVPLATGGAALTVLTSSMAPEYPAGSLMVIRPVPVEQIRLGDVITYQITSGEPAVVSHRVVERAVDTESGEVTFTTKGDNNAVNDALPVREVQVRGVMMFSLPLLGWVNNGINGEARQWVVPLVAGLLFAYAAYTLASTIASRRRRAVRI